MCWAETLRAAALPAMESIEGMVYFHSVQLDREIRKLHSEGISLSQPGAAGRAEAVQSAEFRTVSAARALGWELDGQKLGT